MDYVEPSDRVGNIWAVAATLLPFQILAAGMAPASKLWRYNLCSKFSEISTKFFLDPSPCFLSNLPFHKDLMAPASDWVQHLDSPVVYSIY